jgi:hypothetical protein
MRDRSDDECRRWNSKRLPSLPLIDKGGQRYAHRHADHLGSRKTVGDSRSRVFRVYDGQARTLDVVFEERKIGKFGDGCARDDGIREAQPCFPIPLLHQSSILLSSTMPQERRQPPVVQDDVVKYDNSRDLESAAERALVVATIPYLENTVCRASTGRALIVRRLNRAPSGDTRSALRHDPHGPRSVHSAQQIPTVLRNAGR